MLIDDFTMYTIDGLLHASRFLLNFLLEVLKMPVCILFESSLASLYFSSALWVKWQLQEEVRWTAWRWPTDDRWVGISQSFRCTSKPWVHTVKFSFNSNLILNKKESIKYCIWKNFDQDVQDRHLKNKLVSAHWWMKSLIILFKIITCGRIWTFMENIVVNILK